MKIPGLVYYPSSGLSQKISLALVVGALRALELKQKLFLELEGKVADKRERRARAVSLGATPLEGPVFTMCCECFHKGHAVDCTGRTSQEVGRDPVVAREVKRLWNTQETNT